MNAVSYILLELVAGILSGLIGIGGATIIVPLLVLFFGMSQYLAQGTTLALLVPPIGILATWQYYKRGLRRFSWGRPHMPWLLNRRPGRCEDDNESFKHNTGKDLRRGPPSNFVEDDI